MEYGKQMAENRNEKLECGEWSMKLGSHPSALSFLFSVLRYRASIFRHPSSIFYIPFSFILCLLLVSGCGKKAVKDDTSADKKAIQSAPYDAKKGMFSDFEGSDPVSWGGVQVEIVKGGECGRFITDNRERKTDDGNLKPENQSSPSSVLSSPLSNKCLKATYPKADFPGLSAKHLPSDWSNFGILVMDVFNPSDDVVKFGILIKDQPGGHNYPNRYDGEFAFRPGKNKFILNITGLRANDRKRQIDRSQITEFIVFLVNPDKPTDIYFDNIRLEYAAGSEIKGMKRFDFGTANSEVWPGFLQVMDQTQYNDEAGYGWSYLGQLDAQDRQYPDALFRDWIRTATPFKVDVKNGQHVVYVMLEDPGFWEYYQNYIERWFYAEDKIVGQEKMSPEEFFRDYYYKHMNHEDYPGQSVFEEYVQKRFVWKRFVTDVQDRQLSLKCEPNVAYTCTISAIITAPLEQDAKVQEYLKGLDQQRKEFVDGLYIERIPQFDPVEGDLVKQYEGLGFIPFVKDYDQMLYPAEPPDKSEVVDHIQIFAAQEEKEPFVIGVYPLGQDKGVVEIEMTDLVAADGNRLSKDAVKIQYVQYKLKLGGGANVYTVRGELLREGAKAILKPGMTRYFWMTVNVPVDAQPGVYTSKVSIGVGEAVKEMEVSLKVLPFTLAPLDIAVGLFYAIPPQFDWYEETKNKRWTEIERQLKDMRDHGMNTMALSISPEIKAVHENGDVEINFTFFDEFLHAYKHFGFDQSISGYGLISVFHQIQKTTGGNSKLFAKAIPNAFGQIQWHTKQITGEDMVAGLADEVSNTGGAGIDSILPVAQILKDAGLRATGYLNGQDDGKIFPYLSDVTINNGLKINDKLLLKAREAGTNVWFYNIGQDRFTFGYYLWKTKAKGKVEWHYQLAAVDPYFDLDGRESDYCASYPSPDGPINTLWFELAREGVDDYRYLKTLELAMESGKQRVENGSQPSSVLATPPSMKETLDQAQKFLDALKRDIPVELDKRKEIPDDFYDITRSQAKDLIVELLKEQGEENMDGGVK